MSYAGGENIVCGFDVSGAELRLEVYTKDNQGNLTQQGTKIVRNITQGFENITQDISEMVAEGTKDIASIGSLEVGIALPARFQKEDGSFPQFEDGSANTTQPLSGMHLGKDCWKKDWKKTLQEKLSEALQNKLPKQSPRISGNTSPVNVAMMNDTGVQMLAVIKHAKEHDVDIDKWKNGKVACVAPGSGFGASIAEIDANGTVNIRHNAHMYDAMVAINAAQEAKIRKVFADEYDIVVEQAGEYIKKTQDKLQPFGSYFPLEKDGKKKLYLIEENGKKYILPARFFASKDGLQHLLGLDGEGMKAIGKQTGEQMMPWIKNKLDLIGELLGEYFVQQDAETLKRLGFRGSPGMPYDRGEQPIPTKAILMAGGGLRDTVGAVIQQAAEQVIKNKGSQNLRQAQIYRPDVRTQNNGYNICKTAAERCVELHGRNIQIAG